MDKSIIVSEFSFKAVRSSGAGGQNVNKVSSKVVLTFDLVNSKGLTDEEKILLQIKIATKLTQDGILILTSEEDRSQLKNKEKFMKVYIKTTLSFCLVALLAGCNSSSNTTSSDSTTVTVERGAVLEATVKDANGQIATVENKNSYNFARFGL